MKKLKISISSELTKLGLVENFINRFCDLFDLPATLYGRITLSVIEAVNNAIIHGNGRDLNKFVTIFATKSDSSVKVTVSDEGNGFDYSVIPDPTLPDGMFDTVGSGLYLMKTLSDQLLFENNGRTVSLIFML